VFSGPEELFDCVDEAAAFGSDEGSDAYSEYRRWRAENADASLVACSEWIGDESDYADELTFNATIIATVLGQLVAEGRIDAEAKPFAQRAIQRQLWAARDDGDDARGALLEKAAAAIEAG
jgi:uncharacterized protein YfeS